MEGEGELGEWLKQTGREVARAAGSELKTVAKDKAASYARSMIGEGLKEELGDAAGAVGKVAMEEAKKHGKHKAKELIAKFFGGDGIGRPCAYKVADLRKAVTAARRANGVTGPANRTQLMALGEAHADLDGRAATQVRRAYMEKSPLTVPMLREMRTLIKAAFHPSVSGMSREQIIRYVYMTAKHLGWSWSQLEGRAVRKNQPRGCRGSAAPGRSGEAPLRALGTAPKRKPSAYNLFIRDHMADNPDGNARERFSNAVDAWKAGQGRRSGAKKAASTRATRRELRDDYDRAQAKRKSARITKNKADSVAATMRSRNKPGAAAMRSISMRRR
jgi:hypothetical protein